MTETTDDKLLQQFFSDNRKEIEDNGFSRRVMHHLPDRYYRISQLWSLFCFTLAVVLFFVLDGLQLVLGALRETRSQITDYSGSSTCLLRISQDLFFSIKFTYPLQ